MLQNGDCGIIFEPFALWICLFDKRDSTDGFVRCRHGLWNEAM